MNTLSTRTVRVLLIAGAVLIGLALALSIFSVARVLSAPLAATNVTVPNRVGFEGFLTDLDGAPYADGTYSMRFAVYNAESGSSQCPSSACLWYEWQGVQVTQGLYATQLGITTTLPANLFDGSRWIGVTVGVTGTEMTPRTKVASVPFALTADTVDGRHASELEFSAGMVVMWSGSPGSIPSGWQLCDGTNSTPNLKGRFIVGYNSSDADYSSIGKTGGSKTMAHTHQVDPPGTTSGDETGWWNTGSWSGSSKTGEGSQHHKHSVDIAAFTSGGASSAENRPPYYVLAYICKLP